MKFRRFGARVAPSRSNKLLVEPLEWRGMLSVTIGSLADEVTAGTLMICGPSIDTAGESEQPICTGLLAPADLLSGPSDIEYSLAPPDCELPPAVPADGGIDPVIITDPVIEDPVSVDPGVVDPDRPPDCELPPAVPGDGGVDPVVITDPVVIDPVVVEPIDVRVQFVSSDPGWAAYYYSVGSDGVVQGVFVVASYDEPTIAAFVAEHRDDPSVQIYDGGDCWLVAGFPLEAAPAVPDQPYFWTWSDSADDAVVLNEPALDGGAESPGIDDQRVMACDGPLPVGEMPPVASAGGQGASVDTANDAAAAAAFSGTSSPDTAEATLPNGRRRAR